MNSLTCFYGKWEKGLTHHIPTICLGLFIIIRWLGIHRNISSDSKKIIIIILLLRNIFIYVYHFQCELAPELFSFLEKAIHGSPWLMYVTLLIIFTSGSSKNGSHVYFLLQVFWVILLFCQIVLLFDINVVLMLPWWPDVTIVQSNVTIVVPCQLSIASIHDYLFCYCPLVGILFEVLRIGVNKYLTNCLFTRVEDCYIWLSQIVNTKNWGPIDFSKKSRKNFIM